MSIGKITEAFEDNPLKLKYIYKIKTKKYIAIKTSIYLKSLIKLRTRSKLALDTVIFHTFVNYFFKTRLYWLNLMIVPKITPKGDYRHIN